MCGNTVIRKLGAGLGVRESKEWRGESISSCRRPYRRAGTRQPRPDALPTPSHCRRCNTATSCCPSRRCYRRREPPSSTLPSTSAFRPCTLAGSTWAAQELCRQQPRPPVEAGPSKCHSLVREPRCTAAAEGEHYDGRVDAVISISTVARRHSPSNDGMQQNPDKEEQRFARDRVDRRRIFCWIFTVVRVRLPVSSQLWDSATAVA